MQKQRKSAPCTNTISRELLVPHVTHRVLDQRARRGGRGQLCYKANKGHHVSHELERGCGVLQDLDKALELIRLGILERRTCFSSKDHMTSPMISDARMCTSVQG